MPARPATAIFHTLLRRISSPSMGRLFKAYLPGDKVWCCQSCAAHLAYQDDVMSRNFTGKHGRAFLVSNVYATSAHAAFRN